MTRLFGKWIYDSFLRRGVFVSLLFLKMVPAFSGPQNWTVSGLSAGAYFAGQFHVAFSDIVQGAALIAGGPFYCSQGDLSTALNGCMKTTQAIPGTQHFFELLNRLSNLRQIDLLNNLKDDQVFILNGKNDPVVDPLLGKFNAQLYALLNVKNIVSDFDLAVGHAFPTLQFGNPCSTEAKTPFLSRCRRDVAGDILKLFYPDLQDPSVQERQEGLFSFSQGEEKFLSQYSLAPEGLVYVPQSCRLNLNTCRIHVSFHGCRQDLTSVGRAYVSGSGFNRWAEANSIVVVYPQVVANASLGNPNGCFDWWGYTGKNFHTKRGPQMRLIYQAVERLALQKLKLRPWRD